MKFDLLIEFKIGDKEFKRKMPIDSDLDEEVIDKAVCDFIRVAIATIKQNNG